MRRTLSGLILALVGAPLGTPASAAQVSAAEGRIAFDIPAMALDAALTRYFHLTGVQLLYDSALTTGLRSAPVQGNFTPRDALRRLLGGTGLIVRYSRAHAAIITMPDARAAAPLVPLGRIVVRETVTVARPRRIDRLHYYALLEDELHQHLRHDAQTDRLVFDLRIRVRIDAQGILGTVDIDRGSGDAEIDRQIVRALSGKRVPPPPAELVQPLLVALKSRNGSGR